VIFRRGDDCFNPEPFSQKLFLIFRNKSFFALFKSKTIEEQNQTIRLFSFDEVN
jgi:hypothetical protein